MENDEQPLIRTVEQRLIEKPASIKEAKLIKNKLGRGGLREGAGRPKGSRNKTSLVLREAILAALEGAGGVEYLKRLAIENSSAFAGLLGKVLPSTIEASESSGGPAVVTFTRIVVMPDGHKYIEGVTPKQIAPPSSHGLPSEEQIAIYAKEIKDLYG